MKKINQNGQYSFRGGPKPVKYSELNALKEEASFKVADLKEFLDQFDDDTPIQFGVVSSNRPRSRRGEEDEIAVSFHQLEGLIWREVVSSNRPRSRRDKAEDKNTLQILAGHFDAVVLPKG